MTFSIPIVRWLLVAVASVLVSCATPTGSAGGPKNVIVLYADGVAATQWEFGRYSSRVLRNAGFAVTDTVFAQGSTGFLTTHPHEAFATDSAATASAMSTGVKTTIGAIGVGPDGKPERTAAEVAKAAGKRIGLVTTAEIYDASPAAFSVHTRNRANHADIVDQYFALEPDVMLGGGSDQFLPERAPGGKRKDGRDVLAAFVGKGYAVARTAADLRGVQGSRVLGLFSDDAMDFEIDRAPTTQPSYADMVTAALKALEGSPRGFFLFAENENTDTAGHRNDAAALMRDLWAFDEGVRVALEFQKRHPDTLIVVTGDHETGGLSVTYAQRDLRDVTSRNRFYSANEHLKLLAGVTISLEKALDTLGQAPSPADIDKLVGKHFPGFRLDDDLREAIVKRQLLERNHSYPVQNALGRMVARQSGIYWGTSGHTTEPVVVGAIGPGAERFRGYHDNTDFARILHALFGQP
ncbi:alkaline phosphatase [Piscinibacter koreensis]|uniref:Alkaline phosphatase n=1 Tax=Piscinibacter koreensis TaxID=2742824 RepID=A0A7Y6NS21_9BURK|nr:alkaline phosphatase [Schlegelella koreensis]NUZ08294.1 alkaline phosphatase [Schlegelella koreensis]